MPRTDRASLLVHADADRVFAALADQEALTQWLPPKDMTARFERFDMRTGGSYRLVLTYRESSGGAGKTSTDEDVAEVRIARLDPGERIVQEVDFESDDPAFAGTMRMEWRVRAGSDGTTVEIEASDVPDGIRADEHAEGITSSLANLAAYLER